MIIIQILKQSIAYQRVRLHHSISIAFFIILFTHGFVCTKIILYMIEIQVITVQLD